MDNILAERLNNYEEDIENEEDTENEEDINNSTSLLQRSTPILPIISPRRHRRNSSCVMCRENQKIMSKKHRLCYDCLVNVLSTAKIFTQGFDINIKRDSKMCIVCLNTVKHIGSKYLICIDCLIKRLGDMELLKFNKTENMHSVFLAIDNEYSNIINWQRKKYFPCDICCKDNIEDNRTERLCLDCLIDILLLSPFFIKKERRTYYN
jgi:hypothetical protein